MYLEGKVKDFEQATGGEVGIGVFDKKSGFKFVYNEKKEFIAASLNKLFVVAKILETAEKGKLKLENKYQINPKEMVGGTGIIHLLNQNIFTLYDLCLLSIIESDNTAANKLIEVAGGLEKVNKFIAQKGFLDTKITHKFMLWNGEENSTTSVRDLVNFFSLLSKDKLPMSAKFKEILLEQKNRHRTGFFITDAYASKTADLPHPEAVVHDVGFILNNEGNIVLVVLTEGVKDRKETGLKMQKLGKDLYDYVLFRERLKRELPVVKKLMKPTGAKPDSCNFGKKAIYQGKYWGRHLALDFQARAGEEIKATAEGKVVYSALHPGTKEKKNYGNVVIIAHYYKGEVIFSLYGHLGKRLVEIGETVKMGQVIGVVGEKNTPENGIWIDHLHFGIYKGLFHGAVLPGYSPPGKLEEWYDPAELLGMK